MTYQPPSGKKTQKKGLAGLFQAWRDHRAAQALEKLDPRLLDDAGITPSMSYVEAKNAREKIPRSDLL